MEDKKKPIVILGGGISGLSTAYYLVKAGFKDITILEKEKTLGGVGGFYDAGKYKIDTSYHVAFRGDHHLLELIEELGLTKKMKWFPSKTAFFDGQKFISFSGPFDILKNTKIGLIEKIDFAQVYLRLKTNKNWRSLDRISAIDWLSKNCSKNTFRKFFQPILNIKWGEASAKVSAAWLWGRLFPRAASRNILGGQEKLGYPLPDGFSMLFSKLERKLRKYGAKIISRAEIKNIRFEKDNFKTVMYQKSGETKIITPEIIIVTLPIPIFLKLSSPLPQPLRYLEKTNYQGVICATISLKQSITHGYYQVPITPGNTFAGGVVEHTAAIKSKKYNNENLVYVFKYLSPMSDIWRYSKTKITNLFLKDLSMLSKRTIDKGDILWHHVYGNRFATPIYSVNFLGKIPPIRFKQTNLYFTGMTNTYPITDFNCSIKAAKAIVSQIVGRR